MIELKVIGANIDVNVSPDGVRHVAALDPHSGILIHLMLTEDVAKELAALLIGSGIAIAKSVPSPGAQG